SSPALSGLPYLGSRFRSATDGQILSTAAVAALPPPAALHILLHRNSAMSRVYGSRPSNRSVRLFYQIHTLYPRESIRAHGPCRPLADTARVHIAQAVCNRSRSRYHDRLFRRAKYRRRGQLQLLLLAL